MGNVVELIFCYQEELRIVAVVPGLFSVSSENGIYFWLLRNSQLRALRRHACVTAAEWEMNFRIIHPLDW